jgi:hypothetical protein
MPFTNFPNGVTSLGTPIVGGGLPLVPDGGNYWFVDSATGSSGFAGTYDAPYASLVTAISSAAANDCIVLAAGHAETIATAGGITVNKAGLQIVGEGSGAKRPTFTFSTSTSATFLISSASVKVSNIIGVCNIDQLVTGFSITGADVTLGTAGAPVEWQDSASNKEAVVGITATGANLSANLIYRGQTGGSHCTAGVSMNGVAKAVLNVDFYGKASTAWVNFVTTACANVEVYGYMYNSGTTDLSKDVVDTVTGSTWYASLYDGAAGAPANGGSGASLVIGSSGQAVPSANSTANVLQRDVIGNKTDTAVYVPGTTNSVEAYAKGTADLQERVALSSTAVMVNANTIFTIAGGPILISGLVSECVTGNDTTASTLQYSVTPTTGSAQTISGASTSLASAAAGASITLAGTALATAALYNANGPNLIANPGTIYAPAGTIKIVIGVGSTTGTWRHRIRYKPLATGVTVS